MRNDRAPRSMREAFGHSGIDSDDLPRDPLTPVEAILLVVVYLGSTAFVAFVAGYALQHFA